MKWKIGILRWNKRENEREMVCVYKKWVYEDVCADLVSFRAWNRLFVVVGVLMTML